MYFLIKNKTRGDIWICKDDIRHNGSGYVVEVIRNSFIEWEIGNHCIIWGNEVLDKDRNLKKLKERVYLNLL